MSTAPPQPSEVRQLETPAALALADLAGVFENLQTVLRCCERLMQTMAAAGPDGTPDDLALEAYWTEAVLAYGRCFAPRGSGEQADRGQQLTPDDVAGTGLSGDVLGWHRTLLQVQEHYVDMSRTHGETFSVGVARDDEGRAAGVALTSTRSAFVDETTVRQTGAVAYALSRVVDERIVELQEKVFTGAAELSSAELDRLPLLDIVDDS
jgi:hypothetical protein